MSFDGIQIDIVGRLDWIWFFAGIHCNLITCYYNLYQEFVWPKSTEFIFNQHNSFHIFFFWFQSRIILSLSNHKNKFVPINARKYVIFVPLKTRNLKSTWSDLVLCMFKNKCTIKLFSRNRNREKEKKRIHTFVTCSVKWIHDWKLRLCRWKRKRNATRFY